MPGAEELFINDAHRIHCQRERLAKRVLEYEAARELNGHSQIGAFFGNGLTPAIGTDTESITGRWIDAPPTHETFASPLDWGARRYHGVAVSEVFGDATAIIVGERQTTH